MPAISLEDLHQQIAQRERELEALRQELEARRNQYSALTRRREELQRQLRKVESEIAALAAASGAATVQPKAGTASALPRGTTAQVRPKLGELILTALRESGKAMTARQLSEEVSRRGFPLTGRNPVKSVESRLQEMKQKQLVRRASGQPGYLLVSSNSGAGTKMASPAPKREQQPKAKPVQPAPSAKPTQPGPEGKQTSLRQVLTDLLKNSRKTLSGSELADLALKSGYKTKSAKFVDAVWSMLGQMENVEHVKGKGYRFKKK